MAISVVSSNPPPLVDIRPGSSEPGIFLSGVQPTELGRVSKPVNRPSAGAISTRSTLASNGPVRDQTVSASTDSGSPWTTASTDPSGRLRTQPASFRRTASRRIDSRNPTPYTRPCMRRCRVSTAHFTFMPGCAPLSGERMNRPGASPEAASTMPSLMPNFILRGARLATMTVSRPTSFSGA